MSKQAFWHCHCGQVNQLSLEECPYCHRKKRDNPRQGRALCQHENPKEVANVKICSCGAVHFADASSGPEGRWRHLARVRKLKGTVTGFAVTSPNIPYVHADATSLSKSGALERFMQHTKHKYPWEVWKKKGYRISHIKIEVTADERTRD